MSEPKPFSDEEITNFQQLVDQVEKDMPPMLLIKPGYVEAHKNYVRFLATIADLKKQAEIKDLLARGVMTLAEVYEQLEDAKKRIELMEAGREMFCPECKTVYPLSEIPAKPSGIICKKCSGILRSYPEWKLEQQTATIERLRGAGSYLSTTLARQGHRATHYEGCEKDHPRCMAIRNWDKARQAIGKEK